MRLISCHEPIDFLEELRLRRWARENYVPAAARNADWHTVVLDEMLSKDHEMERATLSGGMIGALVPLSPGQWRHLHGPHVETEKGELLLKVPCLSESPAS